MHIYIYIYIHNYIPLCVRIYSHIYIYIYIYHKHICTSANIHIFLLFSFLRTHATRHSLTHIHIHIHTYTYKHMYTCTSVYTDTYAHTITPIRVQRIDVTTSLNEIMDEGITAYVHTCGRTHVHQYRYLGVPQCANSALCCTMMRYYCRLQCLIVPYIMASHAAIPSFHRIV